MKNLRNFGVSAKFFDRTESAKFSLPIYIQRHSRAFIGQSGTATNHYSTFSLKNRCLAMHRRALNDDEVVVPVRGGGSSAYATLNNDGDEDSDDVTTRRSTLGSVIKSPLMRNVVGFW